MNKRLRSILLFLMTPAICWAYICVHLVRIFGYSEEFQMFVIRNFDPKNEVE